MKKKFLSAILYLCMVIGMLPAMTQTAQAADSYLWPVPAGKNLSRGYSTGHTALDITSGGAGTNVVATKSGTVVITYTGCGNYNAWGRGVSCNASTCAYHNPWFDSGDSQMYFCNWGYGNGVIIQHSDGSGYSMYAHMSRVDVSEGAAVRQGDVLGLMGSTGKSTGAHLHFELSSSMTKRGTYYDPAGYSINNNIGNIAYIDQVTPSQPTVTPSNIKSDFYATIYYPHGGKLLEAMDSGRSDYPVNVQLNSQVYASVDSSDPRCIWHFIRHDDDGSYTIINEYYGRYLDVETGVAGPERNVGTWYDGKEDAPKRWFVTNAWGSDRWYSLLTALDYPAYALDVYKTGKSGGTNVQIYNRVESNIAQQFNIVEQSYKKPSRPSAPSNIQTTASPQSTKITWDAVPALNSYDAREYELNIYNTGTEKYVVSGKRVIGTSYTYILPEGDYKAEVKAINTKYSDYTSSWASKSFTVSSSLSENGIVKLTAQAVPTSSTITYGQRLMDSKLTGGTVADSSGKINGGFWSWEKWNSYPTATGNYKAVFNPLTEEYNSVIYSSLSAQVAVTVNKATPNLSVSATQNGTAINVSTSTSNPYNADLTDLPTPTVTYRIGSGTEQRVTGSRFSIPDGTANGTVITITASIAENEHYQAVKESTSLTVSGMTNETIYHVLTTSGSELGGAVNIQPSSAKQGETVTVTATPRYGYALRSVTATDFDGAAVRLTSSGNGRYTFIMPGSNVTLDAVFEVAQNEWVNPFSDIVKGAWYYDAVKFVSQNGLMNGDNGVFDHSGNLSRAMIAQILYNKEGRPTVAGEQMFSDVVSGTWYANAVTWAAENEIVFGDEKGLFLPNDPITREQLAVILWRYTGKPAPTGRTLNFTDTGRISSYAKEAMDWAVENGIISGKGGGVLDPQGPATRAQAAQMLKNLLEK